MKQYDTGLVDLFLRNPQICQLPYQTICVVKTCQVPSYNDFQRA